MTVTTEILRRTPLHALHVELGAKLVPFAGYEMPVQYPAGILKEHLHTRTKAGLFDVSHMGQGFLAGDTAALERLTTADVAGLKEGMQRYGLLLTDAGTIKDDFMFSRLAGEADLYLVVNAGCKEGDFEYITQKLQGVATLTPRFDRALLALQGPLAATVLERHSPGISALTFMKVVRTTVAGAPPLSAAAAIPARMVSRSASKARTLIAWPARCWPKRSCPSAWARATVCGWKRGFAFTGMTWMKPSIRWRPT